MASSRVLQAKNAWAKFVNPKAYDTCKNTRRLEKGHGRRPFGGKKKVFPTDGGCLPPKNHTPQMVMF